MRHAFERRERAAKGLAMTTKRVLCYEGKMATVTKINWTMARDVTDDKSSIKFGMALKIGNDETPESAMEMHVEHKLASVLFIDESDLPALQRAITQTLSEIQDERLLTN